MKSGSLFLSVVVAVLVCKCVYASQWIENRNPYSYYFGHILNSGPRCAPTAVINTFIYLKSSFPDYYDSDSKILPDWNNNGLISDDYKTSRTKLSDTGWINESGITRQGMFIPGIGTYAQSWWETLNYWIEDFVPQSTYIYGQINPADLDPEDNPEISQWYNGNSIQPSYPAFDFLWNSLQLGAGIIIGIYPEGSRYGHAITLTGLAFEDTDNDFEWDIDELAKIYYVDPNITGQELSADLWIDILNGNRLEFNWWQNPYSEVYLALNYTLVPVPEPQSIFLLFYSVTGLFFIYRKK